METVVKDGKYKFIIRFNNKCQEASIRSDWYASESDTRKNGELKFSLKHTLYIWNHCSKSIRETPE